MRHTRYASSWPTCHFCQLLSLHSQRPVTHSLWALVGLPSLKKFSSHSLAPLATEKRPRDRARKSSGTPNISGTIQAERRRRPSATEAESSAGDPSPPLRRPARRDQPFRPLFRTGTSSYKLGEAGRRRVSLGEKVQQVQKRGKGVTSTKKTHDRSGAAALYRIQKREPSLASWKETPPEVAKTGPKYLTDSLHYKNIPGESPSDFAPTMKSFVEVLTSPTADTPGTCLLLHFDTKSYLIGRLHEGCQRALIERGKRMIKITDLFLTGRVEWEAMGGLLGLMITAADSKTTAKQSSNEQTERKLQNTRNHYLKMMENQSEEKQQEIQAQLDKVLKKREDLAQGEVEPFMRLHGPPNLTHAIATCRRFIFRRGVPLRVREHDMDSATDEIRPIWSDDAIDVFAMPSWPRSIDTRPMEDAEAKGERSKMLDAVVGDMFNSAWRMDALYETRLADVPMPASIFYRDPETHKIERWTGPKPGEVPTTELPDVNVLVRKPWPAAMIADLPKTKPSPVSVSYIVKGRQQRGKFLPDAAKKLGVPLVKFKVLANNCPVELEDGTVVKPEQVLAASRPGRGFAVIDLPSSAYVQSLVERPEWSSANVMEEFSTIFWILGPGVANSEELAKFINEKPDIRHIISSKEHTPNYFGLPSAASLQLRLAKINPSNFPVLEFSNRPKELPAGLSECVIAHPGQVLQLEPKAAWDESEKLINLNTSKVIDNMPKNIKQMAQDVGRKVTGPEVQELLSKQKMPGSEAEVVTLGTGSSQPSKYRNVSATLLRVPGYGTYLFDAGENTMGTLARMFGPQELQEILRDLRMVWISHLHADHHLGTTSVIKAWHRATQVNDGDAAAQKFSEPSAEDMAKNPGQYLTKDRLFVVSDNKMLCWLSEFAQVENFGHERIVPISATAAQAGEPGSTKLRWNDTPLGFDTDNQALNEALKTATGLVDIQTAYVSHCAGAMAVSVTFGDGFKVSYSGDCRPSKRFVEIGKGTTLLIHEATFEDELVGDAMAKKHSTTSEALKVGLEMGAPCIILTHFSQRYAKLPNINNVDNFRVSFDDAIDEGDMDAPAGEETTATTGAEAKEAMRSATSNGQTTKLSERGQGSRGRSNSRPAKTNVAVAFDYMKVKVKDIGRLQYFDPVLNAMADMLQAEQGGQATEGRSDSDGGSPKKRKREASFKRSKKW